MGDVERGHRRKGGARAAPRNPKNPGSAPASGLPDDTFLFGNLVGETYGAATSWPRVDGTDLRVVRSAVTTRAAVTNPRDHNRDGRVNVLDATIVRAAQGRTLGAVTPGTDYALDGVNDATGDAADFDVFFFRVDGAFLSSSANVGPEAGAVPEAAHHAFVCLRSAVAGASPPLPGPATWTYTDGL